jgi:hypothetical protein
VCRSHEASQQSAGRRLSHDADRGTRHEKSAQRGVQLMSSNAQVTPASVCTQLELSSGFAPQHQRGVHTLHVHKIELAMLDPGGGGGWYSAAARGMSTDGRAGARRPLCSEIRT